MKRFEYSAVDAAGIEVHGVTAAADADAALTNLATRGLTRIDVRAIELPPLTTGEAAELVSYLVEITKAGLPLSGQLEALAEDASTASLRRVYQEIWTQLTAGQPLEQILDSIGAALPQHYRRTLSAAVARDDLPQSLDRLLGHQQRIDDMSRALRGALTYPLLLAGMLAIWLLFISWDVSPSLASVAYDYELSPQDEATHHHITYWMPRILLGVVLTALAMTAILALGSGRVGLSWVIGKLPLVGPCWKNRGLADFCGLLGEFVRQQFAMDDALALTSSACRDPLLAHVATMVREEIVRGKSLARAFQVQRVFPAPIIQWAHWGESHAALPEALDAAGELASTRFSLRLQLVRAVLPALVFVAIAVSALMLMAAISHVLVSFVRMLSYEPIDEATGADDTLLGLLGCLVVIATGAASWLTARYMQTDSDSAYAAQRAVHLLGVVLLAAGALAASFFVAGFVGFFVGGVLIIAAWQAAWRYTEIGRQSLWAAMSIAAERSAPLAPMALAVADEYGGRISHDARRLATHLAAGADLAESVTWTSGALPKVAPVALRVGTDAADLAGAFRAAAVTRDASRPLLSPSFAWLAFFLPVALAIITFVHIKIAPSMVTIFGDFDSLLPSSTTAVFRVLESPLLPPALMLLALVVLFLWVQRLGVFQPVVPGLASVVRWQEVAPLLRLLALPVEHGKSLVAALNSMARLHPRRWMRRRLRRVVRDVERGVPWQQSLRRRGIVRARDVALLAAAERNGNLAWALDELGASYQRRAEYKARVFAEFAFPLVVLSMGLLVAFFAVAYFIPLAALIQQLT